MATYLPNEIILQIIQWVYLNDRNDTKTLANLRLASGTTKEFATPHLFSAIKMHAGLEASMRQLDGLSASPLSRHVCEVILTDVSMMPVDMREIAHYDAIPAPEDKEFSDIAARINGLSISYKESSVADAVEIQVDCIASWAIKFTRSLWRLLSKCHTTLETIRLEQDKIHHVSNGTDTAEDIPVMLIFNTLERFDFPKLRTVDLQMFYLRNFRRLSVHVKPVTFAHDFVAEQYYWTGWGNVRHNLRRIKEWKFSSLKTYDVSLPELQEGDAGTVRKDVFQFLNQLETVTLNGRTSLSLFHLLHKTPVLRSFELYRCTRIAGCDLLDVFKNLPKLESMVLHHVHLHKPDKPAEFFGANYTLDTEVDSRTCPWFVILRTAVKMMRRLERLRVLGLSYCREDTNPPRTYVSEYPDTSEVFLRSPYMTDHDELRELFRKVRDRGYRKKLKDGTYKKYYFFTKEVTGWEPEKGLGFSTWQEVKTKDMVERIFEDVVLPEPVVAADEPEEVTVAMDTDSETDADKVKDLRSELMEIEMEIATEREVEA